MTSAVKGETYYAIIQMKNKVCAGFIEKSSFLAYSLFIGTNSSVQSVFRVLKLFTLFVLDFNINEHSRYSVISMIFYQYP
jgi:hypothetical protein